MMEDIRSKKDNIRYVLVFKLSRFARNTSDTAKYLQELSSYGIGLLGIKDGIDTSTVTGKMIANIMGAVAEVELENIHEQTLAGRQQKARNGLWNGAQAPFGYSLKDKKLMLSNPVYTRRVAWGKRRTEKVPGKDNEYRLVKQDEYILSEVISHEAFVSKEDFDKVQEIKAIRGKKGNHNIGQYNAHLLSGIVKCPQCGAPMYIGMTKWTNQDGTERRTESYVCSYATKHRGTSVCRRNGVVASQVEDEVMEYTRKIVRNPQFIKDLQEKVMAAVDMTEVENDITAYKKQQSALQRSRDSLEQDIDRIAPDDKYAERRRADMTRRLNAPYDQNYKAEDLLQESLMKKATLESKQMSVQSMIGILSPFDAIYDRMNAAERRDLVKYLISEVELFPREEQKTQKRFVKAIAYKFPIEQKVLTQFDECGASVETVCLLVK